MSRTTWQALLECHEAGVLLCVATARPERLVFRASEVLWDQEFLTRRGVYYNGARAVDRDLGYLREWPIAAEIVVELTELLDAVAPCSRVALQAGERYHSYRPPVDEDVVGGWGFGLHERMPYREARRLDCSKVLVWHESKLQDAVMVAVHRWFPGRLNVYPTDCGRWIQLTSADSGKGRAALEVLSLHGIEPARAAAIGDEPADIDMLRALGLGIAMANAAEEVKQAADVVTRSNEEDGLAEALRALL